MAGPTPVSALIHAATMVTAGVYMVARLNFLFSMSPFTMGVIAMVGGATALFAATIGVAQNDIKKVLAYSTVSQLGYMFAALGVGAYTAGVFHLMTHAFFKACLFLGCGLRHPCDGRRAGHAQDGRAAAQDADHVHDLRGRDASRSAAFRRSPDSCRRTRSSGRRSRTGTSSSGRSLLLGAGFTVFYMFRQVYMTFFGEFRGTHEQEHHLHESPPSMAYVLIVLGAAFGRRRVVEDVRNSSSTFKPFEDFLDPVFSSEVTRRVTESGIHSHGIEALIRGVHLRDGGRSDGTSPI